MSIFEDRESEVRSYCRHFPVVFKRSKMSILYDTEGNEYLDFLSGAGALNYGHNNDYIKKPILEHIQNDGVTHALDMHVDVKADFLETFQDKILIPRGLDYKVMFCGPTGTNANEAALKLARKVKGRTNIFAFTGGFHGMTMGALSATSGTGPRKVLSPLLNGVSFMPYPVGSYYKGIDTIQYIKDVLEDDHSGVAKPAAIILETVQGEGGINPAPIQWLKDLRALCDEFDILMIVDEVQTGCGRCGSFFSFERAGIVPDMVTMSKSISGYGMPMALLLMKKEIDIFSPAEHNGTFRGIQLSMIGAKAAIDFRESYDFDGETNRKSEIARKYIKENILPLDSKIELRGLGLYFGIDMHNEQEASDIADECFNRKLIIERAGRHDEVVKLMPTLTITDEELLRGLEIIKDSVKLVLGK